MYTYIVWALDIQTYNVGFFIQASMVQKRPLVGDDSGVVSSKHAKLEDSDNHLVSFLEFPLIPSEDLIWKPYTSGEKELLSYFEECISLPLTSLVSIVV